MVRTSVIFSVILSVLANSADAESDYTWGGTGEAASKIELLRVYEDTQIAEVVFTNNVTAPMSQRIVTKVLDLDGLYVTVNVSQVPENRCEISCPDTFSVHDLPPGIVALPETLSVEEGEAGTIRLFVEGDQLLG